MSSRTKAAATAASVIPFHCVICFEEFTTTDRPPMVLPCGHTYVCLCCSKRLKRCMECREPLYILSKKAQPRTNGRYSPVPPSPPMQIPLPIPKNLVLLSMMEAAESQAREDSRSEAMEVDDDDEEEETFDLDRVISSMSTLTGPCGTYAVRDREGLIVRRNDPRLDVADEKKEDDDPNVEPIRLRHGQKVQVVDVHDGVAKLAGGEGFIQATSSQLVKVGAPLNEACRLEGLLDTVTARGRDLQRTIDENSLVEATLRKQIDSELAKSNAHPIISMLPEAVELSLSTSHDSSDAHHPVTPKASEAIMVGLAQTPDKSHPIIAPQPSTDSVLDFDENRIGYAPAPHIPPSPNSIDNSDLLRGIPTYRRADDEGDLHHLVFGCGSSSALLDSDELLGEELTNASEAFHLRARPRVHHHHDILSPARSTGSSDYFQSLQSTPSSSFDGVNWRTGMSGHRALGSSRSHSYWQPQRHIRMMSEHRGIAPARGRRQSPTSSPSGAAEWEDRGVY